MTRSRSCSSRIRRALREKIAEMQNWLCCYCDRPMVKEPLTPASATLEHRVPISLGGARMHPDNIAVACKACNEARGNGPAPTEYPAAPPRDEP